MGVVTKRSSMIFFSDPQSHYSHRVRIVLAEKGVAVEIIDVDPDNMPEEIADHNPYNSLPTLVDRELALYEPNIMMEYLDERFPHPPLLPVYPVARAQSRLLMHRIQKDWCGCVDTILDGSASAAEIEGARKELRESLTATAPIFDEKPFFLNDEFTIVDCLVAPVLWRLGMMKVELKDKASHSLQKYKDRLFARESFQTSLSDLELEMNV